VVNSISLKEGEQKFIEQAKVVRRYGAATVVMAFDEQGQADTFARKVEICARAYKILVEKVGFEPQDIIFDPNVFAVATGIEEHNHYGVDFIEATKEIRQNLPHAHCLRRVSNSVLLLPRQRGRPQSMHSVFLYHAIANGMDMGIVNAGQLGVYEKIDRTARRLRGRRARPSSRRDREAAGARREIQGQSTEVREKDAACASDCRGAA